MGQVGSRCSQARFVPNSEGDILCFQHFVDMNCQPWLSVSLNGDVFLCESHNSLSDVGGHSVCVLLHVCVIVVSGCLQLHNLQYGNYTMFTLV